MKKNFIKKVFIFFIVLFNISYSSTIDDMKKKLKALDSEIKSKNERIENIDVKKKEILKKIEKIKKDIVKITGESNNIKEEIKIVSKNIDYGQRSLTFNSHELNRKKSFFDAKIIAWSRKNNTHKSFHDRYILKRQFSRVLYEDLNRMTKIKNVQSDILEVKKKIEKEKNKLNFLNNRLKHKKNEIDKKQKMQNQLIKKLNSEKNNHIKRISNIEKEKRRIEREIEKVIKTRTVIRKDAKLNKIQKYLGKAIKPIPGKIVFKFNHLKAKNVKSNGIEISGTLGKEIKASMDGKVIYIDRLQGLGKVIMIDYGYNTIGVYGNTMGKKVKVNQRVKQGQTIGLLGYSTDKKAVLYYEVRFNLKPIDPETLF